MKFLRQQVDCWPKLAWCAKVVEGTVHVLHGPRIEYADDWIFEGAWAGDFKSGDFDRDVSVIVGTGIRVRDGMVSFVCSTNPIDRLFYVDRKHDLVVSNSLPCLLSVANLRLDPQFPYSKTLSRFIENYRHQYKFLPALKGEKIHVLSYDILTYSTSPVEQPRISKEPLFTSFEEYECFLNKEISALRANLNDKGRRFKVTPVATISKGYDSTASTVIAQPLGLRFVLTIARIGSFSQHDDSGEEIAKVLGIPVKSVISNPSAYREYDLVWAGLGRSDDLNMTLFEYPEDLTFLVVGTHGDTVWQKGVKANFIDSHHFLDRDPSGCGLAEWRLHKGVFLASIPCIGASKLDCLKQINDSSAMDPWRIGGSYDRPIPRRIVEQKGVKRETFGMQKRATIPGYRRYYPNDPDQLHDLALFLGKQGKRLPRRLGKLTEPLHIVRTKLSLLARRRKNYNFARFLDLPDYDDLFFVWANHRLLETRYRSDIRIENAEVPKR